MPQLVTWDAWFIVFKMLKKIVVLVVCANLFSALKTNDLLTISDLVSQSFGNLSMGAGFRNPLLTNALKLMALDRRKIGAIALNGLIFLAQLLSTYLAPIRPTQPRLTNAENPLQWILQNTDLKQFSNQDLPEVMINHVTKRSPQSGCIQKLICKMAPFMRHFQKFATMELYVDRQEWMDNSDECDGRNFIC